MKMTWVLGFVVLLATGPVFGALKVVTSTTDLAWAVKQIGGAAVEVKPLLRGQENPHYVDTIPDFIRQVADADVVCVVGLDLEIGWMPKVLTRSGNAKVQPGGPGYCETGKRITVMDKPAGPVDRSMGDVHPAGNPHFWLAPLPLVEAAQEIVAVLSKVDPAHQADYQKGYQAWQEKMTAFYAEQKKRLRAALPPGAPLVLEYHKEFTYLLQAYDLKSVGSLEEKPGVAPSAGRIAEVATNAKAQNVRVLLAARYSPKATVEKFEEISGVPALRVATSVPADALDYYAFHSALITDLAKALTSTVASAPKKGR